MSRLLTIGEAAEVLGVSVPTLRRWDGMHSAGLHDDEKLSIVEESCSSGARVADVARRRGLHPNQVHAWRRQARMGELMRSAGSSGFLSVAVTPEDATYGMVRRETAPVKEIQHE